MSTRLRQTWLKLLRIAGAKQFRAKSCFGLPYICHVGDFAGEAPFYKRGHSAAEILLMAEWCREFEAPIIFDIGANNGFIATQLAQLLGDCSPRIYAFEPVPSTFVQLAYSIESLQLQNVIIPLCCAASDEMGMCKIAYNPRESLFAQVRTNNLKARAGGRSTVAAMVTIDELVRVLDLKPTLIKIDVEGLEPRVLTGASQLLADEAKPVICLEYNPITLAEVDSSPVELLRNLSGYSFYYVDDFEGQRLPFGEEVPLVNQLDWVCNLLAVPRSRLKVWPTVKERTRAGLDKQDVW